jgi:hypothetical protein
MPGIYSCDSPEKLFQKLKKDFSDFYKTPSEEWIFSIVFPMYHLRDWICPAKYEEYGNKSEAERTREEKLAVKLHGMPEYEVVRGLCTNAKHFVAREGDINKKTRQLKGKRYGLGRYGDSFGITHYLVDGIEIRNIFWTVYIAYLDYFREIGIEPPASNATKFDSLS